MNETLYTVGHSNRSLEDFLLTIQSHGITAIADVRSQPYSRMHSQFDREALAASLKLSDVAYVFLGKELGARTADLSCYVDDKVQFDRLARTAAFKEGLERVREGMKQYCVALLCAEKEPLACHRTILVARELAMQGIPIRHILSPTEAEDHAQTTDRLLQELEMDEGHLFFNREELIAEAFRLQGQRVAYQRSDSAVAVDAAE
jgi:uncharacterized protein (DUF488 family)